jgi:hypothetical protein
LAKASACRAAQRSAAAAAHGERPAAMVAPKCACSQRDVPMAGILQADEFKEAQRVARRQQQRAAGVSAQNGCLPPSLTVLFSPCAGWGRLTVEQAVQRVQEVNGNPSR